MAAPAHSSTQPLARTAAAHRRLTCSRSQPIASASHSQPIAATRTQPQPPSKALAATCSHSQPTQKLAATRSHSQRAPMQRLQVSFHFNIRAHLHAPCKFGFIRPGEPLDLVSKGQEGFQLIRLWDHAPAHFNVVACFLRVPCLA